MSGSGAALGHLHPVAFPSRDGLRSSNRQLCKNWKAFELISWRNILVHWSECLGVMVNSPIFFISFFLWFSPKQCPIRRNRSNRHGEIAMLAYISQRFSCLEHRSFFRSLWLTVGLFLVTFIKRQKFRGILHQLSFVLASACIFR